jgi:hypothetical protein
MNDRKTENERKKDQRQETQAGKNAAFVLQEQVKTQSKVPTVSSAQSGHWVLDRFVDFGSQRSRQPISL